MLLTGVLNQPKVEESLAKIENKVNKINVLIEQERISKAYHIIDYLGFQSELYISLKKQKKHFAEIVKNYESKSIDSKALKYHVAHFNEYKVQPILNEITLLYSKNFNSLINKNKNAYFILSAFVWFLLFLIIIMSYRLLKFNVQLDEKVQTKTKKLIQKNNKIEYLMSLNNTLLKYTPEGIIGLDSRGFITFLNPSALNMINVPLKALYGEHISNVIEINNKADYYFSLLPQKIVNLFDSEEVKKFSGANFKVLKTNFTLTVDFEITKYKNKAQGLEGFMINFRDVSDRIELEKTIDQERAMTAHASKLSSLGEMAGGIAHEINTPLGVIMLSNDEVEEELKSKSLDIDYALKLTETIRSTTMKVSKIVRALKSMSHLSGEEEKEHSKIDDIIDNALTLSGEKIRVNNVEVIYENEKGSDLTLYCDPVQLSQVILNFISNSLDAIEGLEKKWIKISVCNINNFIIVSIQDSGYGISEEDQLKIFQPFFTTKPVGKGTGLGMPISKAIVAKHGGDIIYDKTSKNTKFDLLFPATVIKKSSAA
ncbi:MAG: PAS domain-containing sensor histidine kinase [Bdellovibrionales bacterium]|nr:PAS domain-containing sensor histidine kinase [Bdellovibrionales bacterium]